MNMDTGNAIRDMEAKVEGLLPALYQLTTKGAGAVSVAAQFAIEDLLALLDIAAKECAALSPE